MNRISYIIGFSWLMLLWATPALTAPAQHEVALAAFRQALQQKETTFALPLGQELSLPLRWSESVNSFSSQGIRTYVGKWQGNSVAYLSIDDKGNVVGNLVYGQGYDISSAGGRLVVAPHASRCRSVWAAFRADGRGNQGRGDRPPLGFTDIRNAVVSVGGG